MGTHQRFNRVLLGLVIPGVLTVGAVNALMDPFGVLDSPDVPGLNRLRPEKFNHVRLFKAADITRIRPKTVFLGTSRTELGLDPQHPALANHQPAYNLGLVGPNTYEVRRYLEHAIANQPDLRTVVLGVDFFMFNTHKVTAPDFSEERLDRRTLWPRDLLSTTVSLGSLEASRRTLGANVEGEAYYLYRPDGFRYIYGNQTDEPIPQKFAQSIRGFLESEEYYGRYQLSEARLADLRAIADLCRSHNIDLKVFISPSHAVQWEGLRAAGLWPVFEEWKHQVVAITPVWDFSGYNSVTVEPVSATMTHYWDSSHYRSSVGDQVLDRLFGITNPQIPADFGVWVTPQTVEAHLAGIRRQREAWQERRPEVFEFVRSLDLPRAIAQQPRSASHRQPPR